MITLGGISTSTKKILIHALDFEFRLFLSFIRRNDPYFAESMIFVQIMLRKVKCGVGNAKKTSFWLRFVCAAHDAFEIHTHVKAML